VNKSEQLVTTGTWVTSHEMNYFVRCGRRVDGN